MNKNAEVISGIMKSIQLKIIARILGTLTTNYMGK